MGSIAPQDGNNDGGLNCNPSVSTSPHGRSASIPSNLKLFPHPSRHADATDSHGHLDNQWRRLPTMAAPKFALLSCCETTTNVAYVPSQVLRPVTNRHPRFIALWHPSPAHISRQTLEEADISLPGNYKVSDTHAHICVLVLFFLYKIKKCQYEKLVPTDERQKNVKPCFL